MKLLRNPDLCRTRTEDGRALLFLLDSPWDALLTDPELDRLVDYFDEHPSSIEEATGHFVSADDTEVSSPRITKAIYLLQRRGILVPDPSRAALYDEQMASSYRLHRAIPRGIADEIAAQTGLEHDTSVLDVGTGTGSLALALSRSSKRVKGIDVSEPLLSCARADAQRLGSNATFARGNANRLVFSFEQYDVVTVCQCFHWLDPGLAVQGLSRTVAGGGSLYMIESKYRLPEEHPLRRHMGFGAPLEQPMAEHCYSHALRYHLLFQLMCKVPPFLRLTDLTLFRQRRRLEFGFARAFFFDQQVQSCFPDASDPWAALEEAYDTTPPERLEGEIYWFAARYQRRPGSAPPPGPPRAPLWIDLC